MAAFKEMLSLPLSSHRCPVLGAPAALARPFTAWFIICPDLAASAGIFLPQLARALQAWRLHVPFTHEVPAPVWCRGPAQLSWFAACLLLFFLTLCWVIRHAPQLAPG